MVMKFGIEIELYLLERIDNSIYLNDSLDILDYIFDNTDDRVYRDYYRYQLEIRSKARNSLTDCIKEVVNLYDEIKRLLEDTNYFIAPISHYTHSHTMYCGMHIHISDNDLEDLITRIYAMYPHMLIYNRAFHSSPKQTYSSYRLIESPHLLAIPPYNYKAEISDEDRYKDITVNYHTSNNRHRLKDCVTLEIRFFDTPALIELDRPQLLFIFSELEQQLRKITTEEAEQVIVRLNELSNINSIDILRTLSANKCNLFALRELLRYLYQNTILEYDYLREKYLRETTPMMYNRFYSTVIKSAMQ